MTLYELLMDELAEVPADARPTEYLIHPAVVLALKAEMGQSKHLLPLDATGPLFRARAARFCDIPVTVTEEVAFAQLKYDTLPTARFYDPDDVVPWQDWS
jgi:hypothetical protein